MKKNFTLPALFLLSALLISCGGEAGTTTPEVTDTTPVTEAVTAEINPRLEYADAAPAIEDFGGYQYRMAVADGKEIVAEQIGYWTEGETGDTINDAIFRRNVAVEDAYHVDISLIRMQDTNTSARKNIQSGDDFCDIMFSTLVNDFIGHAQIGGLVDLNTLPELDMTNPWWDQRISSLSLFGQ